MQNLYILRPKEKRKVLDHVQNEAKKSGRSGGRRAKTRELKVLILNLGLSGEELCRLNIENLPYGEHCIIVHNRWDTKTREVYLDESLETKINEYVQEHPQGSNPSAPFFITEKGNRLREKNVYRMFHGDMKAGHYGIARRVGIKDLTPGVFRRTAKYQLIGRARTTTEKTLSQKVQGITLDNFILKHLQGNFDEPDVAELKKRIQNAHYNDRIDLPKPIGESGRGRHTYYDVIELRKRWSGYRNKFPDYPKLISKRKVRF